MPERIGDHIEVTGKGILGRGMHIKINGVELQSCRRFLLELESDAVNSVTIELTPMDIDIDAEALAELVALVDMKRKRDNANTTRD